MRYSIALFLALIMTTPALAGEKTLISGKVKNSGYGAPVVRLSSVGDQLAVFGIEAALDLIANPDAETSDKETPVDLITAESLTQ